ncbi:MAG: glycine oxidase ThiO [Chromatiales bacterium]|jgi:glycine oxidase|nr:glycine oxidase ThiO [Chromatiales bacterium]
MTDSVTVIGAGVAGLCVATELHSRGIHVSVLDRSQELGADACSWWAGGMLAPWCERESAEEPVARLGAEAADWWQRHAGGVQRCGSLVLALPRDRNELKRFARRTERFGWVDASEIESLEPDLAGRFSQGLYFADEAHLAPRLATASLLDGLQRNGVTVQFGRELTAAADESSKIIDCRGLAAKDALKDLRGVKGEMLVLHCPDVTLSRPIRLLHPRIPLYIVPRGDGHFMVGATMLESDDRDRITARSMLELLGAAYALHPAFGEAQIVEIGVDARPAFPDNLPRLRRGGGRLYANGLYRHGFLLAPALARMTADLIENANCVPEFLDEHHA